MKTRQEIQDEIAELHEVSMTIGREMELAHAERMDIMKSMMALNRMLQDMDGKDTEEKSK